jgi:cytochrome P450
MLAFVQRMMLNQDPPSHTRLRRLLTKSFTPRAIAALEDGISRRAKSIIDRIAPNGNADFASDIAAELPLMTLAEIMGVPEEDRMLLFDWSNRVIGYQDSEYAISDQFDPSTGTEMARKARKLRDEIRPDGSGRMPDPRSREGLADMYFYASELARYRRRHPGDDVVSILLATEDEQGAITTEEFETMFFLFAVAGNETLRNGIPGGMLALLEHPSQMNKLIAHPDLLPSAIEEMLRYSPPVVHFRRTATRAVDLGGVSIRRNDKIVVYHVAANRDPAVFRNPEQFDVERTPNEHVTFGAGPHFCLGAHVARRQMSAIFEQVLWRLPNIELNGEPEHLISNFQNGPKHLPVKWDNG